MVWALRKKKKKKDARHRQQLFSGQQPPQHFCSFSLHILHRCLNFSVSTKTLANDRLLNFLHCHWIACREQSLNSIAGHRAKPYLLRNEAGLISLSRNASWRQKAAFRTIFSTLIRYGSRGWAADIRAFSAGKKKRGLPHVLIPIGIPYLATVKEQNSVWAMNPSTPGPDVRQRVCWHTFVCFKKMKRLLDPEGWLSGSKVWKVCFLYTCLAADKQKKTAALEVGQYTKAASCLERAFQTQKIAHVVHKCTRTKARADRFTNIQLSWEAAIIVLKSHRTKVFWLALTAMPHWIHHGPRELHS